MINPSLLQSDLEKIRISQKKRSSSAVDLDGIADLDRRWREENRKLENLREKVNDLSQDAKIAQANRGELVKLKKEGQTLETKVNQLAGERGAALGLIGNVVADDVPAGRAAEDNLILKKVNGREHGGSCSHDQLMEGLSGLETTIASQFSGSRFRYLIGEIAQKNIRLQQLALDFAQKKGFLLVIPPVIAQPHTLEATGFFPKGKDEAYALDSGQYLVGTSEPMLLVLGANKRFQDSELPVRYVGFSTCFRKEAGSYGKDIKGIFRTHQFDKVELVSLVSPKKSEDELDFLVSLQEEFIARFDLTYQQVLLCGAEQSHTAAKQIDHEVFFPSENRFRETHSASNCTDYQARELKIKVKDGDGFSLAHTLNATLVTERLFIAIVETYQKSDKTIDWPEILR